MTALEDRLRATLADMADEAQPAPLLSRLERESVPAVRRHRLALAAVAAGVVVLLVAVGALRAEQSRRIDPSQQPPKVLRLSEAATLSPGRALLAITLAADAGNDNTPAYLLPSDASAAVRLPDTERFQGSWMQHLSADGSSFVRQSWTGSTFETEIVDLRTGEIDNVERGLACPALSPDEKFLAAVGPEGEAVLLDRGTGKSIRLDANAGDCGYSSLGWSPDGGRLVVTSSDTGSDLRDRRGRLLRELPGRLANGSMSWSPDGRELLMYQSATGGFAVVSADDGTATAIPAPEASARPLGWTGDQVVWLVGTAGEQRLVTSDRQGGDRQPWMRLDIGDRIVDNISWSRALTSAPPE